MRFTYLRNADGHPVATLATVLIRGGHGNIKADMVAWSLATCNPLDTFNRELGRAIAAGRIYTVMPQRMVLVRDNGTTKATILGIISRDRTIPQRAREAARICVSNMFWNKRRGPKKTDAQPRITQIEGTVSKVLKEYEGNGVAKKRPTLEELLSENVGREGPEGLNPPGPGGPH